MKKKTVLALALASAMVVPTVAHVATKVVYAEEEKSFDELKAELVKLIGEVKAAPLSFTATEAYDTVGKIETEKLNKEEVKTLINVVKELKVLLGKELGKYSTKEDSVYAAKLKLDANVQEYGMGSVLQSGNEKLIKDSINEYRKNQENTVINTKVAEVKKAEEALAAAKAELNEVEADDYAEKARITAEIAQKQQLLEEAQKDLLEKENELANKINDVENYVKVKEAVEAVIAKANAGVDKLKADVKVRLAKEAYKKKASDMANFDKQEKIDAAKAKADAELNTAGKKIEDKLKVNTAVNVTLQDIDTYVQENHGNLAAEKVVLIEELLDKADIEAYVAAKKVRAAIPDAPVTSASDEETKYNEAYDELQTKKDALDEASKKADKKVSLLGIAVDAEFSKDFFEKYGVQERAVKVLKDQLTAHKRELTEAKANRKTKEAEKNEAEEALKAKPENEVLKTKFEAAKKALETAQKAVEDAQAKIDEVKGHLANLEAKSKELFEAFRKYNEAVKNGATKAEMDILQEKLARILKSYNDYAKKHNLPTMDINRSEVAEKSWSKVDGVWYYRDKDGKDVYKNAWGKINGLWYRFDEKGAMLAEQWVKVGEEWYWVNANGRLSQNEWVYVNNEWYFANASGRIAQNEWFLVNNEWYFANPSGRMAQNEWFEVAGVWYYAKEDGRMACNETLEINGTKYSFDESGALA